MASRKLLLVLLLVSLLVSADAVCVLSLVNINLGCLLGICNIDNILNSLPLLSRCSDSLISITLPPLGGFLNLTVNTNIDGLEINSNSLSSVTVNLGSVSVAQNLKLNGKGLINVIQGATTTIGGVLQVASQGVLDVAGNLVVQGGATIAGTLHLSGVTSPNSVQTAWITSPSTVKVGGTEAAPAQVRGSGGVDATVQFDGTTVAGDPLEDTNIYVAENVVVSSGALLKLARNLTVAGVSQVYGRVHLNGARFSGDAQNAWLVPTSSVFFEGTSTSKATLTGNGGINGDVILGDYAGMAAGNSPGVLYYTGSVQMSRNSFMEIEVAGSAGDQFDQYIMQKNLYRDGYLYINFLNSYVPGVNNRFNFGAHMGATGTFHTVLTLTGYDVMAVYSNRSTAFVYSDPVVPAYCTCVSVY